MANDYNPKPLLTDHVELDDELLTLVELPYPVGYGDAPTSPGRLAQPMAKVPERLGD